MRSVVIKKLLIGIIFIASAGYTNGPFKRHSSDPQPCLEVVGIALGENNEAIDGVEVKLFRENEEMEWVEITHVTYHDHNFTFTLDVNSYYTIEVSKPGFVKRSVAISTKLPSDISIKTLFKYGFEVVLFKEKKELNDFYLDFPVALISYNPKTEVFENSTTYTRHIKSKIKESAKTEENKGQVSKK